MNRLEYYNRQKDSWDENEIQYLNSEYEKEMTINEIANTISENQTNIPPRIGESRTTLANNNKIKTVFEWEPRVNIKEWVSLELVK